MRDINDLNPEMKALANQVVDLCAKQNVNLLIYTTLRTLEEQAKLYRQSRTTKQVQSNGKNVTNAGPGESLHNYGMAFDAVPIVNGQAAWSVRRFRYPSIQV